MKCLAAAAVFMALAVAAQAAFDERGFNRDLMAHPSHPSNWESGEHGHKVLFRRGHVDTRETPSLRARLAAEPHHARAEGEHGTYVIKLRGPVTELVKAEVEAYLGVKLGKYIPHHSFVVVAPQEVALRAESAPHVTWVGLMEADHKVAPNVETHLASRELVAKLGKRLDTVENLPYRAVATTLHVRLFRRDDETLEDARKTAAAWQEALREVSGNTDLTVEAASARKLVIEAVSALHERATVEWVAHQAQVHFVDWKPEYKLHNKFAQWLTQSGVSNSRPIYDKGLHGENQIIGIGDSGLDQDNCLFANQPGVTPKIIEYIVAPGNDNTDDINGHGTHVSGSVLGYTNSGNAVQDNHGMAYMAQGVFTDIGQTGGGLSVPADLGSGLFQQPYTLGARIHTNSWGSAEPTYTSNAMEVDEFMVDNPELLVLVAAGNDGGLEGGVTMNLGSPATAKNCLAVGAAQTTNVAFQESAFYMDWAHRTELAEEMVGLMTGDCCDETNPAILDFCCGTYAADQYAQNSNRYNEENVAPFSSRGPTADGRIKPELLAPGQYIVSARSNGAGGAHCGSGVAPTESTGNNGALLSMAGTSMATPVMAGNAALVRQYFQEGFYPSGAANGADAMTPTAATVKAILINSGVKLTGEIDLGNNGTWITLDAIPSIFQGFGAVRLNQALVFNPPLAGGTANLYVDQDSQLGTGEVKNYCLDGVSGDVKATLVWTDKEGSPAAEIALVNDLTLFGGRDNEVAVGNWVSLKDHRNNLEQLNLVNERTGSIETGVTHKFQVKAENVPDGTRGSKQDYTLVLTGAFETVSNTDCAFEFVDDFQDAGDEQYFPYGATFGAAAGLTLIGVILMVLRYLQKEGKLSL